VVLPGRRCIRLQHLETFEFRSLLTHELVGVGPRGAVIETMLARLDGILVEPALSKRCADLVSRLDCCLLYMSPAVGKIIILSRVTD